MGLCYELLCCWFEKRHRKLLEILLKRQFSARQSATMCARFVSDVQIFIHFSHLRISDCPDILAIEKRLDFELRDDEQVRGYQAAGTSHAHMIFTPI